MDFIDKKSILKKSLDPLIENFVDYDKPLKELNERMPCKHCGKSHGNGFTDYRNYTHTFIDICQDCFFKTAFTYKPITEKIILTEQEFLCE